MARTNADQLAAILLDFKWLQAKLDATDINALMADYDYLPKEPDLGTLQSMLRQSAHILAGNPRELPGQLLGRVPGNLSQDIDGLRSRASQHKSFPWLRPIRPSLLNPLVRTLQGHTDCVLAVAITPDGRRVVSGSRDKTLRIWDLESGETIRTLQGHTGPVSVLAITSDGRRVVSGSDDKTLRVWDLEDGKELVTFTLDVYATACTVGPDNRMILAGDGFGRVHFLEFIEADDAKPKPTRDPEARPHTPQVLQEEIPKITSDPANDLAGSTKPSEPLEVQPAKANDADLIKSVAADAPSLINCFIPTFGEFSRRESDRHGRSLLRFLGRVSASSAGG